MRAVALFDNHDIVQPGMIASADGASHDKPPHHSEEGEDVDDGDESQKIDVVLLAAQLHGDAHITKEGGRKGNGLTLKGGHAFLKVVDSGLVKLGCF